MLAAQPLSERERIARSGIPPRTFRDVRSRIYAECWLADRYLPEPAVLGCPFVSFLLAEPYVERVDAVMESWAADPRIVHMWRSQHGIFAVGLGTEAKPALPGIAEISDIKAMRRCVTLTMDCRRGPIPVYFDFEAAWSRVVGLSGTLGYPHAWGGASSPPGLSDPRAMSPSARLALSALVRRPFDLADQGRSPSLAAPFFLPPSQQRVLNRGWVGRRVFLDPTKLFTTVEPRVEHLVFVHGTLIPGADAQRLLDDLISACRVMPFLYAADDSRVLLGSLSPVPQVAGTPAPRASISATLGFYLRGIEVFRVPLSALETPLNHRYDRAMRSGHVALS